jgi:hypothetical protein
MINLGSTFNLFAIPLAKKTWFCCRFIHAITSNKKRLHKIQSNVRKGWSCITNTMAHLPWIGTWFQLFCNVEYVQNTMNYYYCNSWCLTKQNLRKNQPWLPLLIFQQYSQSQKIRPCTRTSLRFHWTICCKVLSPIEFH